MRQRQSIVPVDILFKNRAFVANKTRGNKRIPCTCHRAGRGQNCTSQMCPVSRGVKQSSSIPPSCACVSPSPYKPSSKKRWLRASVAVARRLGSRVRSLSRRSPMPVPSTDSVISYGIRVAKALSRGGGVSRGGEGEEMVVVISVVVRGHATRAHLFSATQYTEP